MTENRLDGGQEPDPRDLRERLRDVSLPAGFLQRLQAIPDQPVPEPLTGRAPALPTDLATLEQGDSRSTRQSKILWPMAGALVAIAASLLIWFQRSPPEPSIKPEPDAVASSPPATTPESVEPALASRALELEWQALQTRAAVARRAAVRRELARIRQTSHRSGLRDSGREVGDRATRSQVDPSGDYGKLALTLALCSETSLRSGVPPALLEDDLERIVRNFPGTAGAELAQQLLSGSGHPPR